MLLAPMSEKELLAAAEKEEAENAKKQKKNKLDFDPKCLENSEIIKGVLRKIKSKKYKKKQLAIRDRRIDLLSKKVIEKSSEVMVLEDYEEKHFILEASCEPGDVGRAVGALKTDGIKAKIMFPKKPYKVQETLMLESFRAVAEAKNAMLESPTGTGKTLCLLAACLEAARRLNVEYAKVRVYNREQRRLQEDRAREEDLEAQMNALPVDEEAENAENQEDAENAEKPVDEVV